MKGWYVGHWWVVVLVGLIAGFVGWSVGYIQGINEVAQW